MPIWIEFVGAPQRANGVVQGALRAQNGAERSPVIGAASFQHNGEPRRFDCGIVPFHLPVVVGDQRLGETGVRSGVVGSAGDSGAQLLDSGGRFAESQQRVAKAEACHGVIRSGGDCAFERCASRREIAKRQVIVGEFFPPLRRAALVDDAAEQLNGFGALTASAQRARQHALIVRIIGVQRHGASGAVERLGNVSLFEQRFGEQRITLGVARVASQRFDQVGARLFDLIDCQERTGAGAPRIRQIRGGCNRLIEFCQRFAVPAVLQVHQRQFHAP